MRKVFEVSDLRNLLDELAPVFCPSAVRRWNKASREVRKAGAALDVANRCLDELYQYEKEHRDNWRAAEQQEYVKKFIAARDEKRQKFDAWSEAERELRRCFDECSYLIMRRLLKEAGYKATTRGWKKEGGAE